MPRKKTRNKNKTGTTLVYKYTIKKYDEEIVQNATFKDGSILKGNSREIVGEMIWKGHQYKNNLIELHLAIWKEYENLFNNDVEILKQEEKIRILQLEKDQIEKKGKADRVLHRQKNIKYDKKRFDELKKELGEERRKLKDLKWSKINKNQELKEREKSLVKKAQNEAKNNGLHDGTYNLINEAVGYTKKACNKNLKPPKFFRFDGTGRCGAQIKEGGMLTEDVFQGDYKPFNKNTRRSNNWFIIEKPNESA